MTKVEIWKLRNSIIENIDYLSTQFQTTNDILSDLERMIGLDVENNIVFKWWFDNEESINIINKLLEELKD